MHPILYSFAPGVWNRTPHIFEFRLQCRANINIDVCPSQLHPCKFEYIVTEIHSMYVIIYIYVQHMHTVHTPAKSLPYDVLDLQPTKS